MGNGGGFNGQPTMLKKRFLSPMTVSMPAV